MSRGIVVDHKESGVRYAISESNFNTKVHKKVRELKPGETVLGYKPRLKDGLGGTKDTEGANHGENSPADPSQTGAETPANGHKATK